MKNENRFRLRNSATLAVSAVIGLMICSPATSLAQGGFEGAGRYEISNLQSQKVIDMDRNDRRTIIQFEPRQTANQFWEIREARNGTWYIRNAMNGFALEEASDRNATPVIANRFTGGPSQQWRIDRASDGNALILSSSGKALDIPDGSNRNSVKIQVFDRNGDENQRFVFRRVTGTRSTGSDWMTSELGEDDAWASSQNRPSGATDRRQGVDRRGTPSSTDTWDRGGWGTGTQSSSQGSGTYGRNTAPDESGRYWDDRDQMWKMSGDGVCFYREPGYRGDAYCVRQGEERNQLSWSNAFSSVKFFGVMRGVQLFSDSDFAGQSFRITRDEPDMTRTRGWTNDMNRVASIRAF